MIGALCLLHLFDRFYVQILGIGSWNPEVRDIELPAPQAEVISSFASLNSVSRAVSDGCHSLSSSLSHVHGHLCLRFPRLCGPRNFLPARGGFSLAQALLSPAGLHIPDGDEDPLDLSDGSSDAEISDIRNLSEAQDWRRGNGGDDNPEESSDSAPEDSFFRSIAEGFFCALLFFFDFDIEMLVPRLTLASPS